MLALKGTGRRRARAGAAFGATLVFSHAASALELDRTLRDRSVAAPAVLPAASAFAPLPLRLSIALPQAPGARRYPRATQALIVSLSINADPKGERLARMTANAEFLLRHEDLEEIGMPKNVPAYEIEGETFVELRAVPGAQARFDEKKLALEVMLPPEGFPRQRFDLTTRLVQTDIDAPARSALLNYRLGYAGVSGAGAGNLSLAAEAAVAYRGWLFRSQSFHSRSSEESTSIRLETQAIRDDRENLRRIVVGDNVTPGLVLGSSVPFAGLTLAKAYALSPYLTRQPTVGYRGLAEFPSQVDFYVGNTLVLRQRVAPGPFDIQNFTYYGGQRDVRVVIRDVFGREQSIAYPFYFANQGLAAGLHDYSYQAGWVRAGLGAQSNDYGRFAFSAFHQYGFDDHWTLGLRSEGTTRMVNGGGDAFLRTEYLGLWALHAAASHDRDRGAGHAVSFSHSFQRGEISTQLIAQAFSRHYAILSAGFEPRLPKRDFSANVSYATPALGSLTVGFTRLQLHDEPLAQSVSATYSKPFLGRFNFFATLRRQLSEPRGSEVFLGLQYVPRPNQSAHLSFSRDIHDVRTTSLQWGNQAPRGEGLGYSVNVQEQDTGTETTHLVAPRLEWNTRAGTVGAEVTHLSGLSTGSTTGYSISLAGALVSADGRFAFSRPVADSFAIVEIEPPLEGIMVYENSQEVGRTDARGRVLLPNLASYANNFASIKDKDVPIEYSIDKVGKSFSPSFRSGTLVPFHVERLQTFTGRLQYSAGGTVRQLEYHLVMVEAGGKTIEMPTGKNGEFYAENLPAGRSRATVQVQGSRCEFTIEVPRDDKTAVALGDIMTCHVAR